MPKAVLNTEKLIQDWDDVSKESDMFESLHEYALYTCGGDFSSFDNVTLLNNVIAKDAIEIEKCKIKIAFQSLMGVNGDQYAKEIINTGKLSYSSYSAIANNVQYNSKYSIVKYFGLVHFYYTKGLKEGAAETVAILG